MLYQSHLPMNFWSYALSIASFLINRPPSSALGFISPWEKVNSVSPPLSALRTFGCACYPYLRTYNKNKLQPRFVECVFLEYPPLSKGYMCLDPTTNKIYTTCYALFNESVFPFVDRSNLSNSNVPFSSTISESDWFSVNSPSPSSALPSSSTSHLPTPTDSFPLDIIHSAVSSSCVPNPPLSSLPSSSHPSISVLDIPASTSFAPSSSLLVSTHPMLTGSKLGIHKPKVLKVTFDYTYQEPPSFAIAIKHP